MRRNIKIILLFPLIVFLFLVGWALYTIGDRQTSNRAAPKKTDDSGLEEELTANDGDFEIGLIEEYLENS